MLQGSTDITNLSFKCGRGGRQFTYKHSESFKGFQEAIAAVVDENLENDLSNSMYDEDFANFVTRLYSTLKKIPDDVVSHKNNRYQKVCTIY